MKKIKILVILFFVFTLILSVSNATYTTSSYDNGYNKPIIDGNIKFKAVLKDGKVYTKWTKYNKNDGFKYYIVVRSQKVSNPVYPDNGYIKYSGNINFTEYEDYKVLVGLNYYRVCAITTNRNRYCSNVVKIIKKDTNLVNIIPKSCISWYDGCNTCTVNVGKIDGCTKRVCVRYNTPKCLRYNYTVQPDICTMEYTPICGNNNGIKKTYSNKCMLAGAGAKYLYKGECKNDDKFVVIGGSKDSHGCYISAGYSWCAEKNKCIRPWEEKCELNIIPYKLKLRADYIFIKFLKKIESKYKDNDKRIKILKLVIIKLNKLSREKPKVKIVIDYINKKFNQKILDYEKDLKDIENIFDQY